MTEHTLAYLVRTVYIEIYTKIHITFSFLLKNKKKKKKQNRESSCREPGGGRGRVAPNDFMQRSHTMCKAQLDADVDLYSDPSISSLGDAELQSIP